MTNKYIIEYLSQRKKEINGAEYADMVSILKNAIDGGFIKIYENRLLERIIQIFLKDHKDLYFFTTNDQLKLLQGFDKLTAVLENS